MTCEALLSVLTRAAAGEEAAGPCVNKRTRHSESAEGKVARLMRPMKLGMGLPAVVLSQAAAAAERVHGPALTSRAHVCA